MVFNRSVILREVRDLFFFLLASIAQAFFMCPRCNTIEKYVYVISFTFFMWILLWKGNSGLATYLSSKISWLKFPLKRLIVGVVSTVAYTCFSIIGLIEVYRFLGFNFGKSAWPTVYISVGVTIIISLVLHSREFLLFWKKSALDAEQFQKESIEAKYESLKNQVNPHFLFNSLNALTNLVYEDQDKAVKFIKQLSEVYRYVLETRDKEVVPLEDELKFMNAYFFLQKIRFGDKLNVDIRLKGLSTHIAPLALQMLVENSIKHNIISEDDPLYIEIFHDTAYIIVQNNLQMKTSLGEPSVGIGLENIAKRYEFLSTNKVQVIQTQTHFTVKLPILNLHQQ